ncbi:MAG: hypothetical protein H7Z76_09035 [Methylotenera sp.]|nr:hypothetical protein [Flavobacterium sp.]
MQAHLKTAQAIAQTKVFKRASQSLPNRKIELIPIAIRTNALKKNKKYATHSRHSITRRLNNDNGLQGQTTSRIGYNTGLAKVAVQFFVRQF